MANRDAQRHLSRGLQGEINNGDFAEMCAAGE
jgi:hypothetical protein